MPVFQYKAATPDGEVVNGTMNGNSRAQVVAELQSLGQIPIRVDESRPTTQGRRRWQLHSRRLGDDQIAASTRELSTLLRAGMPLDRALGILVSLTDNERLAQLLSNIRDRVKGGASLADAVDAQDGAFSRFYVNLLRAGEAGGAIEVILERLAEYMENSKEIRDSLVSAMIYPAILVFVVLLSIFILLGYVVPQFTELFAGVGQALPLPTRITIATGEFLQSYGWALLVLIAIAVWLLRRQLADSRQRVRWHGWFLRLPLAGSIITKIEVARFARTLGSLLQNGVPLLKALSIVKDTVSNQVIAAGIERVASSLKEGQNLAEPLAETGVFPPFAVQMIRVGEESGHLEEILMQVADVYDREIQTVLKRALALLEPLLILVLGVIIAAVIISILIAILSVNQLVI